MKKEPLPLMSGEMKERFLDFGEFLGRCVKLLKTNVREVCRMSNISVQYTYRNRILKRVLVGIEYYVRLMDTVRRLLEATPTAENNFLYGQLKESWVVLGGFISR